MGRQGTKLTIIYSLTQPSDESGVPHISWGESGKGQECGASTLVSKNLVCNEDKWIKGTLERAEVDICPIRNEILFTQ